MILRSSIALNTTKFLFTLLMVILSHSLLCAQAETTYLSNGFLSGGIGVGSVIAIVASWSRNHSILWAIIHGFLGWIYVIYYILTR